MTQEATTKLVSYKEWYNSFRGLMRSNDIHYARCWNLENEFRIPEHTDKFKRLVSFIFDNHRTEINDLTEAALKTIQSAISQITDASEWLGLLRTNETLTLSTKMTTYLPLTLTEIARYRSREYIPLNRPPRKIRLNKPLKTETGINGQIHPKSRFIWFTFLTDREFPDQSTTIAKELGLAYIRPNTAYLYVVNVQVHGGQSLFVPTCFDSRLYEAWAPPPTNHKQPWGLTRDLTTGEPRWPELLAETKDHLDDKLDAHLVEPEKIGHIEINYRANRG